MKKVYKDKIVNIENTDVFDAKFSFDYLNFDYDSNYDVEVIFMSDLLEPRKNDEIADKLVNKPAMYSNVYSPKDELEIFTELFENAINNNKKIHIVGITLWEEIDMLERYYDSLWYMRDDVNCYVPNFAEALVTVSVKIENIMWKGSDYKRMWKKIFFNPPVRESGQVKSMFKAINRGSMAGIYIEDKTEEVEKFLSECVVTEKILPLTFAKLLKYNGEQIGFSWNTSELIIEY